MGRGKKFRNIEAFLFYGIASNESYIIAVLLRWFTGVAIKFFLHKLCTHNIKLATIYFNKVLEKKIEAWVVKKMKFVWTPLQLLSRIKFFEINLKFEAVLLNLFKFVTLLRYLRIATIIKRVSFNFTISTAHRLSSTFHRKFLSIVWTQPVTRPIIMRSVPSYH